MALDLAAINAQVQRLWAMFAGSPVLPNDATKFLNGLGAYSTPTGTTPGGAAGGDLTGTYPNPTIVNAPYRDALLLNYLETTDLASPLTVSANTWTDLLANKSFTVVNANHLLDLNLTSAISLYDDSVAVGTIVSAAVRVQIDSATSATNYFLSGAKGVAASLNSDLFTVPGAGVCIGSLSAGAHTVKVQVLSSVALNTGSSGFYLRAAAVPNFEFLRLQVIERGGY